MKDSHTLKNWLEIKPTKDQVYERLPKAWKKWVNNKVRSCRNRARRWNKSHSGEREIPPSPDWKKAIIKALRDSKQGKAKFSHYNLSLKHKPTDPRYPSLEHASSLFSTRVAVEIRLVNDMKSIMSDKEFRRMIDHLQCTSMGQESSFDLRRRPCKRSF